MCASGVGVVVDETRRAVLQWGERIQEGEMATSSITRNFVVEGEEQVEMFANAIEESYQESLVRNEEPIEFHELKGEEISAFMKRWLAKHGYN